MEIILFLLFFFISLTVIGYPFLPHAEVKRTTPLSPLPRQVRELTEKKESLRRELEAFAFDYTLGRFSGSDYEDAQNRCTRQIERIEERIAEIQQAETESIDEVIEQEVRRAMEKRRREKGEGN